MPRATNYLGVLLMTARVAAGAGPDFEALWDFRDPEATEAKFRARLAEVPGPQPGYRLQLMTQVARCQGLRGDFAGARGTLAEVAAALADAPPVVRARYRLELGRVENSSGDPVAAGPHFEAAVAAAEAAGDDALAIDAVHMLAIVAPEAAEKEQRNLDGIARAKRATDPRARKWLASLANNLAWTYHEAGEYTRALEQFETARDGFLERGQEVPIRIARWSVARCLRSLGRYEEALAIQRRLEGELAEAGESDGYIDEEIAELLLVTAGADAASSYFRAAAERLAGDSSLDPARRARLRRLGGLADEPAGPSDRVKSGP